MRRIVEEDLRYRFYTIKVRHILSEDVRTKRLERGNLLLRSLRREERHKRGFFECSDKYGKTLDGKFIA